MLDDCKSARKPVNKIASVGAERSVAPADLKAVCAGIGTELRTLHSDALREEIPDRIAQLLRQLDQQPRQLDQQKDADGT